MDWAELTIYAPSESIDALTGMLADIGIANAVVDDPAEMQKALLESEATWDAVDESVLAVREPSIKIYLSKTAQGSGKLSEVTEMLHNLKTSDPDAFGRIHMEIAQVRDEDWENSWKQFFKPLKVGRSLYICPAWDIPENSEGRQLIIVDPASSFGSGQHETTRLCLAGLEDAIKGGERVIDVGCGSGILAVAALKLGASKALGIDVDANALLTSAKTARLNGIGDELTLKEGDLLDGIEERSADIIVANLFSNIIVRMAPGASKVLKRGGLLLASGLIEDGMLDVERAFAASSLKIVGKAEDGEWRLVAAVLAGGEDE